MAKEPETAPEQEPQEQPAAKKNGALSVVAGVGLLLALMVGSASAAVVVASLALRPPPEAAPAEPVPEEAAEAAASDKKAQAGVYELAEPLIVNVRDTQQRRFLSVRPVFTLASAADAAKMHEKDTELKHALITALKSKTLEQLDDPQIANILGREIQEQLNAKLDIGNAITKVQFTQLVVQ